MKNKYVIKLTLSGMLIALGVSLSTFYIPIGPAKCFPIQHLINVLSAVLLGPVYGICNAFLISLIRNMSGLGSLLAFPGSMIGALFAGLLYKIFKNIYIGALGELIGTGIIGSIVAYYVANLLMGKNLATILALVIPFFISSLSGVVIAVVILKISPLKTIIFKEAKIY